MWVAPARAGRRAARRRDARAAHRARRADGQLLRAARRARRGQDVRGGSERASERASGRASERASGQRRTTNRPGTTEEPPPWNTDTAALRSKPPWDRDLRTEHSDEGGPHRAQNHHREQNQKQTFSLSLSLSLSLFLSKEEAEEEEETHRVACGSHRTTGCVYGDVDRTAPPPRESSSTVVPMI